MLLKAAPDKQRYFAQNPEIAIAGDFPTLVELNNAFGNYASEQWLAPQIADMVLYTGAKNLDKRQQGQLAGVIVTDFFWLKMSEIMLFFHRFKTGRYGRFYGSVDPMVVTCALRDFVRERNETLARMEQEERERKEAEEKAKNPPMSYEEYLRWKEENQKTETT